MQRSHILITGASGAGGTTLGRALATALALPHHDTDDYYWTPTIPPYRVVRPLADRLRLAREMFLPRAGWVLSGAVDNWGADVVDGLDLVVFVLTPTDVRLERLRAREARHFGAEAIGAGGWRHSEAEEFFDWASHYDDGTREGRSRARHEAWLGGLECPVVRLDGTQPVDDMVAELVGFWRSVARPASR